MVLNDVISKLKNNHTNFLEYYQKGKVYKKVYSEVYEDVINALKILITLDIKTGDKVGVIGKNSYEWIILDLASIYYGVITVPIDTNQNIQVSEIMLDFDLKCIFTNLKELIDEAGKIYSFQIIFRKLDHDIPEFNSHFFKPNDIFTIVFTSGTLGKQKAIEIRTKSLDDFLTESCKIFEFHNDDKILVFLPLSVYIERCYIYGAILKGFNILVIPLEYVFKAISENKPTIIIGIPYFFETFAKVFIKKMRSNILYFILYIGYKYLKKIAPGLFKSSFILFKKAWGGNIRYLLSGSAPVSSKILQFYYEMGIILYEGYGMSELGGMITLNYPGNFKLGSVGKPFPNKKIFFDEQGQILVKSSYGANDHYYMASMEENNSTFLPDGIVATGDIGYQDEDGYIYLKGRNKELIALSNGKKLHPTYIEGLLLESNLIRNCLVFGDNKPYITALIVPQDKTVNEQRIKEAINKVNILLPNHEQIMDFIVKYEPFSTDNLMLTNSMKTNRKYICEKFRLDFEKLYN